MEWVCTYVLYRELRDVGMEAEEDDVYDCHGDRGVEGEGFKGNCVDAVGGNEAWRKMLEKIMCTEHRVGSLWIQ